MRIEIWSDVVCPWCYIGKRNLETALSRFDHRERVEVVWRSFELDPRAPRIREGDYAGRLARKYGVGVEQAQMMIDRMTRAAAAAGLTFRFDIARSGNTFDAHRLLHLASERGMQDRVKERLLAAYFVDGEPIGEPNALLRLATAVGLDRSEARAVLGGDDYAADVRADEERALSLEITGVPFFLIDGRFGVPGAQAPDVLLSVLERAWTKSNEVTVPVTERSHSVCEDDSCEI